MRKKDLFLFPFVGVALLGLLGLGLLIWPDAIIGVFPPLIGAIMLIVGIHGIVYASVMRDKLMEPGLKLVQGLVTLLVGFVFIIKQDVTLAFLTILFGLYVLVSSAIELGQAISGKGIKGGGLVGSLAGFVWGLLLLLAPFSGASIWARCLGVYFIVAAMQHAFGLWGMSKKIDVAHAAKQAAEEKDAESKEQENE